MAPSRPPPCSLKVVLDPPRSEPARAFYTNGDLVRGQVRLELELDPNQLADSPGQVKAEGMVQLEYGWQAKQVEQSKDNTLPTHDSPKTIQILSEGPLPLSTAVDKPGSYWSSWYFELTLPFWAGPGLEASVVTTLPDSGKDKKKGKHSAHLSGPSTFSDPVLSISHSIVTSANLTLAIPRKKAFLGRKYSAAQAISVDTRSEVDFRVKPSAVGLLPAETPSTVKQTLEIPFSHRSTSDVGNLAVSITPSTLAIPTTSEFVPVKLNLAYAYPYRSSSVWKLWKGKEVDEGEKMARDRFLMGSLEGAIHVWTDGRERLVVVPFEPLALDVFSDDARLASEPGLDVAARLRFADNLPPASRGVDTGSFKTTAGSRTFDLFLQLTFTPADNAPLVPPPLTLCKNLLELAFVAPFLPPTPLPLLTPPNSASTLQLPFPTDGLDGSTSTVNLLDVKQPYPSSRPSNASFSTPLVGSDGQSSKPLPMLPPDSSGHPPPSSSDARVVPEKFRDVSDKYLEAERRARTRRRDDGGGQDDEGEPPAYDG